MLGVKCDNRESVHGPKKVALTPNIGLEMEMSDANRMFYKTIQTRSGGDLLDRSSFRAASEDEL